MLNNKDPLIAAVQKVMQSNQTERDAVSIVNEKFGVTDRRALPRERQHEWDAAYKTVLTEGLHPNQQKLDVHEPEKDELTAKDFEMLRAKKKPMEEATDGDTTSPSGMGIKGPDYAPAGTKPDYAVRKTVGPKSDLIKKSSTSGAGNSKVTPTGKTSSSATKSSMEEEKKMKGDDPCWDNYEMIGMKKGKGGKPVPNCVPVKEEKMSPDEEKKARMKAIIKKRFGAPGKESVSQSRRQDLEEKAPPGREDQVKALKKKFPKGSSSPFAIAWSSYNKSKVNENWLRSSAIGRALGYGDSGNADKSGGGRIAPKPAAPSAGGGSSGSLDPNGSAGSTGVSGSLTPAAPRNDQVKPKPQKQVPSTSQNAPVAPKKLTNFQKMNLRSSEKNDTMDQTRRLKKQYGVSEETKANAILAGRKRESDAATARAVERLKSPMVGQGSTGASAGELVRKEPTNLTQKVKAQGGTGRYGDQSQYTPSTTNRDARARTGDLPPKPQSMPTNLTQKVKAQGGTGRYGDQSQYTPSTTTTSQNVVARKKAEPIKVSDTEIMNSPEYKKAVKSVGGNKGAKNIQIGQRVIGLGSFNQGDTITSRVRTQLAAKRNADRES